MAAVDDLGLHFAATLDRARHDMLVVKALAVVAADKRLIRLNDTKATKRRIAINLAHELPDLVAHAEGALVGHAKLALQFHGRHAVPRDAEQVHGEEPVLQRRARLLERRPDARIQVVAAVLALVSLPSPEPNG
jgi:trehalose-6-phosphatase